MGGKDGIYKSRKIIKTWERVKKKTEKEKKMRNGKWFIFFGKG